MSDRPQARGDLRTTGSQCSIGRESSSMCDRLPPPAATTSTPTVCSSGLCSIPISVGSPFQICSTTAYSVPAVDAAWMASVSVCQSTTTANNNSGRSGSQQQQRLGSRGAKSPSLMGDAAANDAKSSDGDQPEAIVSPKVIVDIDINAAEPDDVALFADDEHSHVEGDWGRLAYRLVQKRRKAKNEERSCQVCLRSKTPRWRRGPTGARTLCNVCGLVFAKRESKRLRQTWLLASRG